MFLFPVLSWGFSKTSDFPSPRRSLFHVWCGKSQGLVVLLVCRVATLACESWLHQSLPLCYMWTASQPCQWLASRRNMIPFKMALLNILSLHICMRLKLSQDGREAREGGYMYNYGWFLVVVWQKVTQHCKRSSLQLKKKKLTHNL